jgi:hypothetical protein
MLCQRTVAADDSLFLRNSLLQSKRSSYIYLQRT